MWKITSYYFPDGRNISKASSLCKWVDSADVPTRPQSLIITDSTTTCWRIFYESSFFSFVLIIRSIPLLFVNRCATRCPWTCWALDDRETPNLVMCRRVVLEQTVYVREIYFFFQYSIIIDTNSFGKRSILIQSILSVLSV